MHHMRYQVITPLSCHVTHYAMSSYHQAFISYGAFCDRALRPYDPSPLTPYYMSLSLWIKAVAYLCHYQFILLGNTGYAELVYHGVILYFLCQADLVILWPWPMTLCFRKLCSICAPYFHSSKFKLIRLHYPFCSYSDRDSTGRR